MISKNGPLTAQPKSARKNQALSKVTARSVSAKPDSLTSFVVAVSAVPIQIPKAGFPSLPNALCRSSALLSIISTARFEITGPFHLCLRSFLTGLRLQRLGRLLRPRLIRSILPMSLLRRILHASYDSSASEAAGSRSC